MQLLIRVSWGFWGHSFTLPNPVLYPTGPSRSFVALGPAGKRPRYTASHHHQRRAAVSFYGFRFEPGGFTAVASRHVRAGGRGLKPSRLSSYRFAIHK